MTGLEAATAAAGFASLAFDIFHGCVEAASFLSTAQRIGKDGALFQSKLQYEQFRLLEWGLSVELDDNSRPDEKLNWALVHQYLEELLTLLTSAEKVNRKYHLNCSEAEVTPAEKVEASGPPRSGVGKRLARLRPEAYNSIRSRNSIVKRLIWAAHGKEQFERLIIDIRDINDRLAKLLDDALAAKLQQKLDFLLRDLLSRSTTEAEVDEIKGVLDPATSSSVSSVHAAATLKYIRLVIGSDKREDEVKPMITEDIKRKIPELRRLKYRKLTPYNAEHISVGPGLHFARYNSLPVLVEWKSVPDRFRTDMEQQVMSLALTLGSMGDRAFHSLVCKGWLPSNEEGRYALVFDLPTANVDSSTPDPVVRWSLAKLISAKGNISLTRRYEIALALSEAVLQLHTAGWLHKAIRSENVVFFARRTATSKEVLQTPPYLVGYEYARPDTAAGALMTELPDDLLANDLYRHPQARGTARQRYQKRFDLYGLGCTLLELALWSNLVDIQASLTSQPELAQILQEATNSNAHIEVPSLIDLPTSEETMSSVSHRAGQCFAEVISLCLSAVPAAEDEPDTSLEVQKEAFEKLTRCWC